MALSDSTNKTSTRNVPERRRKTGPTRKADNRIVICEPNVHNMWQPTGLITLKVSMACYRTVSLFTAIRSSQLLTGILLG
jgi:hypothetical protein